MDGLRDMQEDNSVIMTGLPTGSAPNSSEHTVDSHHLLSQKGLASFSRYAVRVRRRYEEQLTYLAQGAPSKLLLQNCYAALQNNHGMAASLRMTRAVVMERLITLDCDQSAPLSLVTQSMTELAEWALDVALRHAMGELQATHGQPVAGIL